MKQGLPAIDSEEVIILNNSSELLLDKLILIVKNYIYVIRCKKLELSFHGVLSHIKHYYKLETNVAVSKNKLDKQYFMVWIGIIFEEVIEFVSMDNINICLSFKI